jgi:putative chitinase
VIDRKRFFDRVRADLFAAHMTQGQVDGCAALLNQWDGAYRGYDLRWLAYVLATAYHETGQAMQPIEEWGKGKGRAYGAPDPETGQTYYGRGYVQLTWRDNYARQAGIIGVDFVRRPELVLLPDYASAICLTGMARGQFTGRSLEDYFAGSRLNDPVGARKIINGKRSRPTTRRFWPPCKEDKR